MFIHLVCLFFAPPVIEMCFHHHHPSYLKSGTPWLFELKTHKWAHHPLPVKELNHIISGLHNIIILLFTGSSKLNNHGHKDIFWNVKVLKLLPKTNKIPNTVNVQQLAFQSQNVSRLIKARNNSKGASTALHKSPTHWTLKSISDDIQADSLALNVGQWNVQWRHWSEIMIGCFSIPFSPFCRDTRFIVAHVSFSVISSFAAEHPHTEGVRQTLTDQKDSSDWAKSFYKYHKSCRSSFFSRGQM